MLRGGRLENAVGSVLEQTGRSTRGRPPVLFLRTGGGWQLLGLLTADADELRTCLDDAVEIDGQENVDAFVCVAPVPHARRIAAALWGAPEPDGSDDELVYAAASLAGEAVCGVTEAGPAWAQRSRPDPGARRLRLELEAMLL